MARPSGRQMVLFSDGTSSRMVILVYQGACLKGQPTAYVIRNGQMVWLRPGQSVEWIEVAD